MRKESTEKGAHMLDLVMSYVGGWGVGGIAILAIGVWFVLGIKYINPSQVGLVRQRLGRPLTGDSPIAFGILDAGYKGKLMGSGFGWRPFGICAVTKHPWVQIPAGGIGVVISQIGGSIPQGQKTATYKAAMGNFTDLNAFVDNGGQKGVQRPVLQPGTLLPIHPIAFVVLTNNGIFGHSISGDTKSQMQQIKSEDLVVRVIEDGKDVCGVITILEGPPVENGDTASRLGGFEDVRALLIGDEPKKSASTPTDETPPAAPAILAKLPASGGSPASPVTDAQLVEALLDTDNAKHASYQNFQAFLDAGGQAGIQHDPILYGSYAFNPFCVRVEMVPMLVVEQGEVAVVKSYIGLPTADTSGPNFKHGSIVRPGHRGLWQEPLRTGKYALNPKVYSAVKVPTKILTLNWADYNSTAHQLDADLKPIDAKSKEGFEFHIDLQVQLHIPDTMAPRVISRVGSMENLVRELLQGAVGNHFRNKLQGMTAVKFIEDRHQVQKEAEQHVSELLGQYEVETIGVYIQDVKLPAQLIDVLQAREIANQQVETFKRKKASEDARRETEEAKGQADMQRELVAARVGVDIKKNNADARKAEGDGEAHYVRQTGTAQAEATKAMELARATGFEAQVTSLGREGTARVQIARELAHSVVPIVPQISGGGNSSLVESLIGLTLSEKLNGGNENGPAPALAPPAANPEVTDKSTEEPTDKSDDEPPTA